MAIVKPLNLITKKLFQRDEDFNNFNNLTETDLKNIDLELKKYIERTKEITDQQSNIEKYKKVIIFLTSRNIHLKFKTYDEKILFLIKYIDPNLIINKLSLETEEISNDKINSTTNEEMIKYLKAKRSIQSKMLENKIRNELGFYEPYLLKYEKAYYQKYSKNNELSQNIKIDLTEYFFDNIKTIDLTKINEEQYEIIKEKVKIYKELIDNIEYKTIIFNILNQNEILKLNNIEEKIIFFILIIDPELNLLKIFEEESNINQIKQKAKENLGFFNLNLIKIEKLYKEKFFPEKKLSIWSK